MNRTGHKNKSEKERGEYIKKLKDAGVGSTSGKSSSLPPTDGLEVMTEKQVEDLYEKEKSGPRHPKKPKKNRPVEKREWLKNHFSKHWFDYILSFLGSILLFFAGMSIDNCSGIKSLNTYKTDHEVKHVDIVRNVNKIPTLENKIEKYDDYFQLLIDPKFRDNMGEFTRLFKAVKKGELGFAICDENDKIFFRYRFSICEEKNDDDN